jgi:hypothetical protein
MFDMAIDAGVQYGYVEFAGRSIQFVRGSAPLSLGINLSQSTSLYLHGGPSAQVLFGYFDDECYDPSCKEVEWVYAGELGLGAEFRVSPLVALRPEMSFMFSPGSIPTGQFGLGISFGVQPTYEE